MTIYTSSQQKIRDAIKVVKHVQETGMARLEEAIAADYIYGVSYVYAECISDLDRADVILTKYTVIYNEILESICAEHRDLSKELRYSLRERLIDYSRDIRDRLRRQ